MGFFKRSSIGTNRLFDKLNVFKTQVDDNVQLGSFGVFDSNTDYEAQFSNVDSDIAGSDINHNDTTSSDMNNTNLDVQANDVNHNDTTSSDMNNINQDVQSKAVDSKDGSDSNSDYHKSDEKFSNGAIENDTNDNIVENSKGADESKKSSVKVEGGSSNMNGSGTSLGESDSSASKAGRADISADVSDVGVSSGKVGSSSGTSNENDAFGSSNGSSESSNDSGRSSVSKNGISDSAKIKDKRKAEASSMIKYVDSNGQQQEISLSDYRESLTRYGLTDEDIDRLLYDDVSLQDLLTEIMNDGDSSRRKQLYDSQFFIQMKSSYDSVDISQVDENNSKIDNLKSEKAKLEARATNLKKTSGRDTYQGKIYSADELKAIADLENKASELGKQIEELESNSKQVENGNYYKNLLKDINSFDDLEAVRQSKQDELDDLLAKKTALEVSVNSYTNVGGTTIQTSTGRHYDVLSLEGLSEAQRELSRFNNEHGDRIDELTRDLNAIDNIIGTIETETYERVELLDPYESKADFDANNGFVKTTDNLSLDLYEKYKSQIDYDKKDFTVSISKQDEAKILYYMINGAVEFNGNSIGTLSFATDDKVHEYYSKWLTEGMEEGILTDEEIQVFNYIYNTEGAEAALNYLNGLEEIVDQRYLYIKTQHDQAFADEHPFLASVGSVLVTPIEGMNAIAASFNAKSTDDKLLRTDVYSAGDVWRAKVSQNILESSGEEAAFIYNTVMSMADSAELFAIGTLLPSGAPVFSALLMGSRAYVSTLNDALDRGLSDDKAIMLAASSAIVETAMENYSLGHFLGLETHLGTGTMKLVHEALSKTDDKFTTELVYCFAGAASQGFVEGEEEFATEVLNYCFDELISGDLSNMSLTIQNYIDQGYTEEHAKSKAMEDFKDQLCQAFLGGFASGVCFGAFGSVRTTHDVSKGIAQTIQNEYNVSDAEALVAGLEINRIVQNNKGAVQLSEPSDISIAEISKQDLSYSTPAMSSSDIKSEFSRYASDGIGEFNIDELTRAFSSEQSFDGILLNESYSRNIDFLRPFHEFYEMAVNNNYSLDSSIMNKLRILDNAYLLRVENLQKMNIIFGYTMASLNIGEQAMVRQVEGYLQSGASNRISSKGNARSIILGMTNEEIEIALRDYLKESDNKAEFKKNIESQISELEGKRANLWALGENGALDSDLAEIDSISQEIESLKDTLIRQNIEDVFSRYVLNGIGEFRISDLGIAFKSDESFNGILVQESYVRDISFLKGFHDFSEMADSYGLQIDDSIMDKLKVLESLYDNRMQGVENIKNVIQDISNCLHCNSTSAIRQIEEYLSSGDINYISSNGRGIISNMSRQDIELAIRDYYDMRVNERVIPTIVSSEQANEIKNDIQHFIGMTYDNSSFAQFIGYRGNNLSSLVASLKSARSVDEIKQILQNNGLGNFSATSGVYLPTFLAVSNAMSDGNIVNRALFEANNGNIMKALQALCLDESITELYEYKYPVIGLLSLEKYVCGETSLSNAYWNITETMRSQGWSVMDIKSIVCDGYKESIDARGYDNFVHHFPDGTSTNFYIQRNIDGSMQGFSPNIIINELNKLPFFVRSLVDNIFIYDTLNPFDFWWQEDYNEQRFHSAATGGDRLINFWQTSFNETTIPHEIGHTYDQVFARYWGVETDRISSSRLWANLMAQDFSATGNQGITGYATKAPVEDFAESFMMYFINPNHLQRYCPNRYNYINHFITSQSNSIQVNSAQVNSAQVNSTQGAIQKVSIFEKFKEFISNLIKRLFGGFRSSNLNPIILNGYTVDRDNSNVEAIFERSDD